MDMKQIFTKKLFLLSIAVILLLSTPAVSQEKESEETRTTQPVNLVKINLGALLLKNYSFQYERLLTRKITFAAGLRFAPTSNFPFKDRLESLIDDEDTWESIKDFKTGNFAFTPEVRFYMGKGNFNGFYIAPFVRYANYKAEVPFRYDTEDGSETIMLKGDVTALTGGLLFGAQWNIGKRIALDWWILGPNYGTSNGNLDGKKALSPEDQQYLLAGLEDLDELPLLNPKYTVDSNGARVKFDGPWAGLRAGISLGFKF